jgi:hypothetical protein
MLYEMQYSAVDGVHRRYMQWITIQNSKRHWKLKMATSVAETCWWLLYKLHQ